MVLNLGRFGERLYPMCAKPGLVRKTASACAELSKGIQMAASFIFRHPIELNAQVEVPLYLLLLALCPGKELGNSAPLGLKIETKINVLAVYDYMAKN